MYNKNFLLKPNLPDRAAECVIMSDRLPQLCEELNKNYHTEILTPSPLPAVTGSERFHADMSVCHLGGREFISHKAETRLNEKLSEYGAEVTLCDNITAAMPKLNVCFLGDKAICCRKKTADEITAFCEKAGVNILDTKQSYAKCSVTVVSENAVITSDNGIAGLCKKNRIDCLLIPCGDIELDGYDYGFIGGCCGLLSNDLLVFSGDIRSHPAYRDIRSFAANYGVAIQSLGNNKLYDIGGIIPIF